MKAIEYMELKLKKRAGKAPIYQTVLNKYPNKVEKGITVCRAILYSQLRRSKEGSVPLANLVYKMGTAIASMYEVDLKDHEHFHIGVPFLEAFANAERIVELHRQGEGPRAPWVVYPTAEYVEATKYIRPIFSPQSIDEIEFLRQGGSSDPDDADFKFPYPLIKRWGGPEQEKSFRELLDEPFIKACNVLMQTPWVVNEKVLRVVEREKVDKWLDVKKLSTKGLTGAKRIAVYSKRSKAGANLAIVEQARELNGNTFYQYLDLDWRGRIYYKEPFLNLQGNDVARGMMKFAEAKPLGESGLFWLAVHTANSYNQSYSIDEIPEWCQEDYRSQLESQGLTDISVDKMSLEDRARWTQENMDSILMTGYMEGLPDCEKPYSYLACCFEYVAMQSMKNPEWHFCSLPIAVDGSNNGWQHLGAMLKDELTGSLVGMVPARVPNDLYLRVAKEIVNCYPDFFEERGMKMKQIRKAIAKRGTMTKAYSAGKKTIAENMWNDVVQLDYDQKYNISHDDCQFLAEALVDSINQVCPKPMEAMKFLQGCASEIVENQGDTIKWISPSGFPVEQNYNRSDEGGVWVTLEPPKGFRGLGVKGKVHLKYFISSDYPDKKKHAASISPNFVHSQDAAHLALTVAEWGQSFGAVHDSFSVHACDIEDLLVVIKSTFVDMYNSEDFLGDVANHLGVDNSSPATGDLDINEIMNCDFFFA